MRPSVPLRSKDCPPDSQHSTLSALLLRKLVLAETPDALQASNALQNYRRACDTGRGGIFFCVARGQVRSR